jgi:hypothetical protein
VVDWEALPGFSQVDGLVIRQGLRDPVPFAVIERRLPTPGESRIMRHHGLGLQITKSLNEQDGQRIVEMMPSLEHLLVTGVDLELEWIARLSSLKTLTINGVIARAADLSTLGHLVRYAGGLEGAESAFDAPRIESVDVYDVREGVLPALPSQLRSVSLTDLQGTRGISARDHEPQLREVALTGARRFAASSLLPFRELRSIALTQVVAMTALDALEHLPHLETLSLESCRDLFPMDVLRSLSAVRIQVWGRGKFAAKMRAFAGAAPNWEFH